MLNLQLNPKTYSELADYSITYGDRLLDLASPKVMGIINATSDSFYANSRVGGTSAFLKKAEQMISEGAYIIDLGAFSSRPTAIVIEEAVEWSILEPLIQAFITEFPQIPLSIDTFRSNIAEKSLDCGVRMINDISAGQWDATMYQKVHKYNAAYIMMHMRGAIGAMMEAEHLVYENLISDNSNVSNIFSISYLTESSGIPISLKKVSKKLPAAFISVSCLYVAVKYFWTLL